MALVQHMTSFAKGKKGTGIALVAASLPFVFAAALANRMHHHMETAVLDIGNTFNEDIKHTWGMFPFEKIDTTCKAYTGNMWGPHVNDFAHGGVDAPHPQEEMAM